MKYRDEISELVSKRRNHAMKTAFQLFAERTIEEINMTDIADAAEMGVATLYRYFGTKLKLCVELGAVKWREYAAEVEAHYDELKGEKMNAYEEFAFYLDSYIMLFDDHKDFLRYIANFDLYVRHENASAEDMTDYYESVNFFADKFHIVWQKAQSDHTLRSDVSEQRLFFSVMYTMLTTAQKLAYGVIYPRDGSLNCRELLETQKQMFLQYEKA